MEYDHQKSFMQTNNYFNEIIIFYKINYIKMEKKNGHSKSSHCQNANGIINLYSRLRFLQQQLL
jgi:hypothetical protein